MTASLPEVMRVFFSVEGGEDGGGVGDVFVGAGGAPFFFSGLGIEGDEGGVYFAVDTEDDGVVVDEGGGAEAEFVLLGDEGAGDFAPEGVALEIVGDEVDFLVGVEDGEEA